jgi:hypothetical protein
MSRKEIVSDETLRTLYDRNRRFLDATIERLEAAEAARLKAEAELAEMRNSGEWLKTADIDRLQDAEARAIKAEAECNTCQAGLKASINRFIKAEAALREIMAAFENPATSEDAAGYIMFEIARTALEGKL